MKKLKKLMAVTLSALLAASALTACKASDDESSSSSKKSNSSSSSDVDSKTNSDEEIYFLNFKPEIAEIYEEIAEVYKEETGVTVKVNTAASGTYEQTLKSEIAKTDAPVIFQINGPVGYESWKDYCLDLKDTEIYQHLTDKSLAVTSGDGVYGIPYVVEGYGIIYNDEIMQKYFALSEKTVSISSAEEIKDFNTLKAVVEDMTANKDELGIKGVFASTSLIPGEDWRWQTHLLNLPMYMEFKENTSFDNTILAGLDTKEINFKYSDNFKNIFDLYINNSITDKALLGSKSVDDSMAEFALGNVAMVQNGNWAWSQINGVDGNVTTSENIKFLPIYTGSESDSSQGLCVGTENYLAINKNVSESKQKAAADFLNWLFSSEKGKDYVTNKLGFIAPFDTFSDDEKPSDPLARELLSWMEKDGVTSIPWAFASFPSQEFKDNVGAALLEYVQGSKSWDDVVSTTKDQWKNEKS